MIKRFVDKFMLQEVFAKEALKKGHPNSYQDLVTAIVNLLINDEVDDYINPLPDPKRIVEVDHGNYQGSLLYVIGAQGYQPSTYWAVLVDYGSCSGCDTLQAICSYDDELPTDEQVSEYWTLMLHIVQGLKQISGYNKETE